MPPIKLLSDELISPVESLINVYASPAAVANTLSTLGPESTNFQTATSTIG